MALAALTPAQRKETLARLILKAQNGQIDGDKFLDSLLTALGVSFDADLAAEAQSFLNELTAAKAASDAQSLELSNKIAVYSV